jgi:sugar phosphate isomerase/epimerase
MPSCHYNMTTKTRDVKTGQLSDEFKRVVEAGNMIGQKYLINPWMDASERNLESVKQLCDIMNQAGAYCKSNGLKFGYHNHAFEFDIKFGDKTMYEYILENTNPKLVKMEMDMGWVSRAGHKPLDWFKKHPGRFHLSHMKDMVGTDQDTSTIIGNGIVDFRSIIENKKLSGMKYWIVELEHYRSGSVQDVGVCYSNLRKLLV